MTKFCTECGREIQSGVAFCTECGSKAPVDPVPAANTKAVTEAAPAGERPAAQQAPKAEPQPQPRAQTQAPPVYAQPAYQQPTYQQPGQTYTAPPAADPTNKVVGTGAYFGLMLLFALPVIGFIICIIMCFAPKNKNIKHFARANLIWAIIALIIGGLLIGGICILSNSLMDYVNQATDGQFSGWGELLGELDDLEDLIRLFENGGFEGLPFE